jgi:hypothetical protein
MKRWSELCDRLSVEKQRWFRNEHPRSPPQPVRRKQRFDDPASLPRVRATGPFGTWISTRHVAAAAARSIRKRSGTWWARRVSPRALPFSSSSSLARGDTKLCLRALCLLFVFWSLDPSQFNSRRSQRDVFFSVQTSSSYLPLESSSSRRVRSLYSSRTTPLFNRIGRFD